MKYRAGWVVINSETIIENGFIEINGGLVSGFGSVKKKETDNYTDLGDGVIIPSIVNCHTHLELSSLKDKIPYDNGFEEWVKILIAKREKLSSEDFKSAINDGIKELKESGCLTVGEISTLFLSCDILLEEGMKGVFFKEYLGNNSDFNGIIKNKDLSVSYAGHAPHSTSPSLIKKLKSLTLKNNLPFSIHTAESDAESEFILKAEGNWADFLTMRGIDYKSWPLKKKSSVQYLDELGVLDDKTICVHLINTDKKDLSILKERKSHICLCPRSNLNLHKKLPDIKSIIDSGLDFCLGTDSLASVNSLSIFDEMKFIGKNMDQMDPKKLFEAATINGARALKVDNILGDLSVGKMGVFIYLDLSSVSKSNLIEKTVNCDFTNLTIKSD